MGHAAFGALLELAEPFEQGQDLLDVQNGALAIEHAADERHLRGLRSQSPGGEIGIAILHDAVAPV